MRPGRDCKRKAPRCVRHYTYTHKTCRQAGISPTLEKRICEIPYAQASLASLLYPTPLASYRHTQLIQVLDEHNLEQRGNVRTSQPLKSTSTELGAAGLHIEIRLAHPGLSLWTDHCLSYETQSRLDSEWVGPFVGGRQSSTGNTRVYLMVLIISRWVDTLQGLTWSRQLCCF